MRHCSQKMDEDVHQFQNVLQGILKENNEIRLQSESLLETISVPSRVILMVHTIRLSEGTLEVKSLACVLLRRLFTNKFEEIWEQLSAEQQSLVKQELLSAVEAEEKMLLKRKICEAVAELARSMLDEAGSNQWPEVLKLIYDMANTGQPIQVEAALHILSTFPGIFGTLQSHYLDVIKQMFGQSLMCRSSPQVVCAAIHATTAFLVSNGSQPQLIAAMKELLPYIIQGVDDSCARKDDDSVVKCLIEMAESVPKFLRPYIDRLFSLCLKLVSDSQLDDSWRQLSLEVIVTMCETAPAMIRKYEKYIKELVPKVLALMVEVEEEDDWAESDSNEEEDQDCNAITAEAALDRMSCALGGKLMLPTIMSTLQSLLQSEDWRHRHAGLMAISACAEGCRVHMEAMLSEIIDAILPFLQDVHPRVQYAACNAIGQLCTDFGPNCQQQYHSKMLPALLAVMGNDAVPRVQAHGAAALVNFSEECPKAVLIQYLPQIIDSLQHILNSKLKQHIEEGRKLVLEQVIVSLASVADTAESQFADYYDRFMPCLKFIIQNATAESQRLLRGKTIECISLIGLAVGKEKFSQDCSEVMELLLQTQTDQKILTDDDPQISYMISAWARMCKILGADFQRFLPVVMGPVLKAASLKPEFSMVDSDEMKTYEDDEEWQFVTLGDQQYFGIRTAGLEEKATACQMLVCYAKELKVAFAEYSEEVVKIMVPLLKFYFHDDVRIAASESLPYLLECASVRGEQYVTDMWSNYICPNLLKAIEIEPEMSVLPEHFNSLAKCVEKLGKGCLSDSDLESLVSMLNNFLSKHFERQCQRHDTRKDEDYDDVVEEGLQEEDEVDVFVLSKITDVLHAFFTTHNTSFLPVFDKVMPCFVKMLEADRPWADRQWSLCVWDDVLEHCGPWSVNYQQYFLSPMIHYITDKRPEVRQAAAYGVGVMAQFGGQSYADACNESIKPLVSVIEHADSRKAENVSATENAISAVVKVCKYNGGKVNVDELIPRLSYWLPVSDDADEAGHIYGYICDLLETNHPGIMGENGANVPHVFATIAEAITNRILDTSPDVHLRLLNIVRQIQANEPMFEACMVLCPPEQHRALSEALRQ